MAMTEILALVLCIVCAYTDMRKHLIYNIVTVPAIAGGILINGIFYAEDGLRTGFLGSLVGLGIGILLVLIAGFGGGDMKLMAAFGAFVGPEAVLKTTFLSIIIAGLFAIIYLILRKEMIRTLKRFWLWIISRFGSSLTETNYILPFAPAFLVGAVLVLGIGVI